MVFQVLEMIERVPWFQLSVMIWIVFPLPCLFPFVLSLHTSHFWVEFETEEHLFCGITTR
jgi:hypothetical protein